MPPRRWPVSLRAGKDTSHLETCEGKVGSKEKRWPVYPMSPSFVKVFPFSPQVPHTPTRTNRPCPVGISQNKRREKDRGQGTRVRVLMMLMWFCPAVTAQGKPLGSCLTQGCKSGRLSGWGETLGQNAEEYQKVKKICQEPDSLWSPQSRDLCAKELCFSAAPSSDMSPLSQMDKQNFK